MATEAQAIITIEDAEKLAAASVSPVVSQAQSLTVEDDDSCELAGEVLKIIARKKNEIKSADSLGGVKDAAYRTWKKASDIFNKYWNPLEMAENIIKGKVSAFYQQRERERRELEIAEAERLRKENETAALAEAAQLEASGDKELAAMVLEEAQTAPAPVVVMSSNVPKMAGIFARATWTWRCEKDEEATLRLIVKAAAQDDRYLAFLMLNTKVLNSTAKAQKSLMKVPGVQAYDEGGISVRA